MLSKEDNERLVRIGPGTPMGELMRRFWLPALLESELAEPDGPQVRLRLLGEDLIAFRDTEGRIGVLDAYCPHRLAHLYFGRNEGGGIRCAYHGWKFDVEGRCLERPSEPPEKQCPESVRTRAYPTEVRGGVVWIYMGPAPLKPPLPDFEWARVAPARRTLTKRLQQCNWAQAVEGGIDSSHVSFLHSDKSGGRKGPTNPYLFADRHPIFELEETGYGMLIGARRNAGPDRYYWRITQFLLPFWSMIPPVGEFEESSQAPYDGHAWVPIDDENTWTWSFGVHPSRDYTAEEQAFFGGPEGMWGPIDDAYRPLLNKTNDYGLDRGLQRAGNFTGIRGIPNQDAAVQESMGPITDRSRERLGHSDRAIVAFRRLMLRLSSRLEAGEEPQAAASAELYGVRSASVVLDRAVSFQTGAKNLIRPPA